MGLTTDNSALQSASRQAQPIVMQANYRQFGSGEDSSPTAPLQSRLLAWCRGGTGVLTVNGTKTRMDEGDVVFAPWNAACRFKADRESPFFFAAVQLIPHLEPGGLVDYQLLWGNQDRQPYHDQRQDASVEGLSGEAIYFRIHESHRLGHLMHYIITWFQEQEREEATARMLGTILVGELAGLSGQMEETFPAYPKELRQILTRIDWGYKRPAILSELEKASSCSRSTVCRLFRKHLDTTPTEWILSVRMKHAARLLSSTNLRVYEVGRQVGLPNPYYFCRLFKRVHGITSGEYRRRTCL